jgi:3-oxoacyl-[acyl-carrier protein] reductase
MENGIHPVRPIALVTGAATGIGRTCALHLAKCYEVWIGYNNHATAAEEMVASLRASGVEAHALHLNYMESYSIQQAIGRFSDYYSQRGREPELALLVTNAGIFGTGYRMLMEIEEAEWDQVWRVNVTGTCQLLRHCSPLLGTGSLVVNISSMVAHLGAIGYKSQAHYAVTKATMDQLVLALGQTPPWKHVRIINILPGLIDTSLLHDHLGADFTTYTSAIPLRELGTPTAIAEMVSFLASPEGSGVSAQDLLIDGGWSQKGWSRFF